MDLHNRSVCFDFLSRKNNINMYIVHILIAELADRPFAEVQKLKDTIGTKACVYIIIYPSFSLSITPGL